MKKEDGNIQKKILTSFLVIVLVYFFVGCYSSPTIDSNNYVETNSSGDQRVAGAKVFIIMTSGEEYTGELLYVRDSTMLVCEQYEASEEDLSNSVYQIYIIRNRGIDLMEVEGESKILEGIAIGAGIGIAVGTVIGLADGDDSPHGWFRYTAGQKALIGGCGLGTIGGLVGLIIGATNTTADKEVYNYNIPEDYDFTLLNFFSRYKGDEPAYLKALK